MNIEVEVISLKYEVRSERIICHQTIHYAFHFGLSYPWISEAKRFAETNDWRKQGSFIGAAIKDEGRTIRLMG